MTAYKLRLNIHASRDIDSHMLYLTTNGSRATANRFAKAVSKTITRIQEMPEAGARWESDHTKIANLRFQVTDRFRKYIVFYRIKDDTLEIMRVLHSAQDLENRLQEIEE